MTSLPVLDDPIIGVMTDLHGNTPALEAVLGDGCASGVRRWLILGDLALMGPDPVGVIQTVAELDTIAVLSGNGDRYVVSDDRPKISTETITADADTMAQVLDMVASFGWTKGCLSRARELHRLDGLVSDYRAALCDGTRLLAVHASMLSDEGEGLRPGATDDELRALFPAPAADLVFAGHTHEPTDRDLDGVRYVNPGSVSNPPTSDKAARYCIIHNDPAGHALELRAVDYDHDAVADLVRASTIPGAERLIDRFFA